MDAVIARRVITDVVAAAEKTECPKGYNVIPTKQNLNDTVENETGFEIKSGPKGRPRKKRFICIAYGLEELDEEVLTDLKILDTSRKAPPQYTLLPKTRDTGEDVLQDKHIYIQKRKPSRFEWVIDSLVICPSTVSQGKRRREDSGSDTPIGNVSDSMTLYCKKRFIYLDSETTSQTEAYYMATKEHTDSDCPKDENSVKRDTVLEEEIQTEHSPASVQKNLAPLPTTTVDKSRTSVVPDSKRGENGCKKSRSKGKGHKLSNSFSDPSPDTGVRELGCILSISEEQLEQIKKQAQGHSNVIFHTKHVETKWQEGRRANKIDNTLIDGSSNSEMTSGGTKQDAGETGWQIVRPKGKRRKSSHIYSDPSMDIGVDKYAQNVANVRTEVGRKNRKDSKLPESSSNPEITSGKFREKKKMEKKLKPGQSNSGEKDKTPKQEPTEDPDSSIALHMLSVSDGPKRVTRSSIIKAPPLPTGKMYHVFFSYRHCKNDREWVRGIIKRLESPHHNYKCCIHDRDFMPGHTIIDNIEQAIKESVRVAVVLTDEYIKSSWCKYEATVVRDPGCKACIIPLILNDCSIPQSLKDLTCINVSDINDGWWEIFLKALKGNIPYLPSSKSEHVFLFHDDVSEKDMERVEKLRSGLESSVYSFRCISRWQDFAIGRPVEENVHECAAKAVTTVFVLSMNFPQEKWLKHWQGLSRKGFKLFPLKFDRFELPDEFKEIAIFDATREQDIWLPKLINKLLN